MDALLVCLRAAMAVRVSGLGRVCLRRKGVGSCLANPVFYAKVARLLGIGVRSVWPTLRFMRQCWCETSELPDDAALAGTRRLIGLGLMLAAVLPVLVVLMVWGIGA
ncbi:DUF2214 family protein [Denitromonas iodatirespirans]|uniref:DUF2214 family protein n=1 Tax=Denitromonas iodatirespirans TaxID=2795389 RepID=A0A944DC36_DENI1|nr:DUF2214 family protein [Denitromonas iodatirespirans]MBT0962301.1 DUF2214 family protein [Denitromonas iodatirespirans]